MQSQSFHFTVPRAQSCNFEVIHEFSTLSITIPQILVPIARSPSDSDTILQIVEDSQHVGALQSAFIQSWDACHNQFELQVSFQSICLKNELKTEPDKNWIKPPRKRDRHEQVLPNEKNKIQDQLNNLCDYVRVSSQSYI